MSVKEFVEQNCLARAVKMSLPVLSYRQAAETAGWSRDIDNDGCPCFMNERGTHEYSYASSWAELCEVQGIAPITSPSVAVIAVTDELAARLERAGEAIRREGDTKWWIRAAESDPHLYLADEPAFTDLHETPPAPGFP